MSPLTPTTLHYVCHSAGVAAHTAECQKHSSNDPKWQEIGWLCVPLAVESYGTGAKRPRIPSQDYPPFSQFPSTAQKLRLSEIWVIIYLSSEVGS